MFFQLQFAAGGKQVDIFLAVNPVADMGAYIGNHSYGGIFQVV